MCSCIETHTHTVRGRFTLRAETGEAVLNPDLIGIHRLSSVCTDTFLQGERGGVEVSGSKRMTPFGKNLSVFF